MHMEYNCRAKIQQDVRVCAACCCREVFKAVPKAFGNK